MLFNCNKNYFLAIVLDNYFISSNWGLNVCGTHRIPYGDYVMNGIMILCLKYLWVDLDVCIVNLFFNAQVIQYFVVQISEHMDDNIGSKDPCKYLTCLVVNII